jgi:tRNA pseudouridine38-40 synthase
LSVDLKKYILKTRYFIFLSYKGTTYHGWQVQPNSVTIQEILDRALSTILKEKILTTGAGRTDTGVHALIFCAHFESTLTDVNEQGNLIYRLNRYLPDDIAISGIRKVIPEAHARFNALSRTYKYYILKEKDPFMEDSAWYLPGDMDIKIMNKAALLLTGFSDFTSFSRLHTSVKTNTCRIFEATWRKEGNRLVFIIRADRFLRNMVRAIVGTIVEVGYGKKSLSEFENIILAGNRAMAGKSAPARGLFLTDIEYPDYLFI